MSSLVRVETWPRMGFPDRMWDYYAEGPGNPLVDAYARAARPVDALYSESLVGLGVSAQRKELRLHVAQPRDATPEDQVLVEVWRDQRGMPGETGFVHLGRGVDRLGAGARSRLALEVAHTATRLVVEARGGDPAALDACRDHVEASAFVFTRSSPWKTSPGRRHQARATYRISDPDGFARVRLELRWRGKDEVLATSPPAVAACTARDLGHSASTLGWTGSADVALVPLSGMGTNRQGLLTAHIDRVDKVDFNVRDDVTPRTPGVGIDDDPDAPLPTVVGSLV